MSDVFDHRGQPMEPWEYDDEDYRPDDAGECSHCIGEGICMDGADPLGNCPDEPHRCHACGGSGKASDQTIW